MEYFSFKYLRVSIQELWSFSIKFSSNLSALNLHQVFLSSINGSLNHQT